MAAVLIVELTKVCLLMNE